MLRIILFSILLAALPAAQADSSKRLMRYSKPLRSVSMNLETGTVTRAPQPTNQAVVTTSDLKNLDLGGFIGLDSGGGFCEWIDSAFKGSGAQGCGPVPSDLVSNFVFAYCSSALDVTAGGPGGTMTWGFYPSHTTGAAHPATSSAVGFFTLSGLPANTTAGCALQSTCFFIEITFGSTPLPFPDGQIGYSWVFEDLDCAGVFAATFPFLSCVSSCSGTGPDAGGMVDFLDQYCPAKVSGSVPLATFSFGTTAFGGYFTSINIDMREIDVTATVGTYQGSTPSSIVNPDLLTTTPVVIGGDWHATVTPQAARAGTPGFNIALILVQMGGAPGVSIIVDLAPIFIGFGSAPLSQLLVTGGLLGTATANWGAGSPGVISIPLNTNFVCLPWYAQAIVFGDVTTDGVPDLDPMFSNAASGIVGSQ